MPIQQRCCVRKNSFLSVVFVAKTTDVGTKPNNPKVGVLGNLEPGKLML